MQITFNNEHQNHRGEHNTCWGSLELYPAVIWQL